VTSGQGYVVSSNDDNPYVTMLLADVLEAFERLFGQEARPWLSAPGLRYQIQMWNCVVGESGGALSLQFSGAIGAHECDRVVESLVREIESTSHQALDWHRTVGTRRREIDALSGDVISPAMSQSQPTRPTGSGGD